MIEDLVYILLGLFVSSGYADGLSSTGVQLYEFLWNFLYAIDPTLITAN